MTLASFVELYFNDREHHVRDTTMDTKRNVFDTKIGSASRKPENE